MIKAVIFDRDGVLIDSEFTNVKAAELAFSEFGIALSQQEKDWIVGRHPDDYLIPLLEKYGIENDDKFRKLQSERYFKILDSTPFFEKAIDLLKELHDKKLVLGLCTSSDKETTFRLLEKKGIRDLFQEVVAKGDCSKRKPNPEPYLITAKKLGVQPDECLVIEDSDIGLKSALNAGMKCVIIFNEYTKNQNFTGAFKVVGSADEIELEEVISL